MDIYLHPLRFTILPSMPKGFLLYHKKYFLFIMIHVILFIYLISVDLCYNIHNIHIFKYGFAGNTWFRFHF
jgi:hypothetical protein